MADSKQLTDLQRRAVFPLLSDIVLYASCQVVPAKYTFDPGHQPSWRNAVTTSVDTVVGLLAAHGVHGVLGVFIDGKEDSILASRLRQRKTVKANFVTRADATIASVSAASIIAKVVRNDLMLDLHKQHPQYMWNKNYGYGTAKHLAAVRQHGLCPEHRRIKSLQTT